jgi:hypothetical protein
MSSDVGFASTAASVGPPPSTSVPTWVAIIDWQHSMTACQLAIAVTVASISLVLKGGGARRAPRARRLRSLRHRRITIWHQSGVPARELAERAGHARPSMSLDVYSHVMPPDELPTERYSALIGR